MTKKAGLCKREKTISRVSGAEKTKQLHARNQTGLLNHTIHRSELKWIKDLSVKPETIKL